MSPPLKVGLIGSRGQLGSELVRHFSDPGFSHKITLRCLDRPSFDITSPDSLAEVAGAGFDLLINTSAYNAVDRGETEVRDCFELNAFAPLNLAGRLRNTDSVWALLKRLREALETGKNPLEVLTRPLTTRE